MQENDYDVHSGHKKVLGKKITEAGVENWKIEIKYYTTNLCISNKKRSVAWMAMIDHEHEVGLRLDLPILNKIVFPN